VDNAMHQFVRKFYGPRMTLGDQIAARLHEVLDGHLRSGFSAPGAERGLAACDGEFIAVVLTVEDVAGIAALVVAENEQSRRE
jgi:hypothetical protein